MDSTGGSGLRRRRGSSRIHAPPLTPGHHSPAVDGRNSRKGIVKGHRFDNVITLRQGTLRIEPDVENPGRYLLVFIYDAQVAGRISLMFNAKEDSNGLIVGDDFLPPLRVERGLVQEFKQLSGNGIDISTFERKESLNGGDTTIHPLAIKMEVFSDSQSGSTDGVSSTDFQITYVAFEEEGGEYEARVTKQITMADGKTWDIHRSYSSEICVVCQSDRANIIFTPCGHKCMCTKCVEDERFESNNCPMCREPCEESL